MLTKSEALQVVNDKLRQMPATIGHQLVIVEEKTRETSFGWVIFYDSQKFLETNDVQFAIAGNGPVMVDKNSGSVVFHGAGKPATILIAEYEDKIRSPSQGEQSDGEKPPIVG